MEVVIFRSIHSIPPPFYTLDSLIAPKIGMKSVVNTILDAVRDCSTYSLEVMTSFMTTFFFDMISRMPLSTNVSGVTDNAMKFK